MSADGQAQLKVKSRSAQGHVQVKVRSMLYQSNIMSYQVPCQVGSCKMIIRISSGQIKVRSRSR